MHYCKFGKFRLILSSYYFSAKKDLYRKLSHEEGSEAVWVLFGQIWYFFAFQDCFDYYVKRIVRRGRRRRRIWSQWKASLDKIRPILAPLFFTRTKNKIPGISYHGFSGISSLCVPPKVAKSAGAKKRWPLEMLRHQRWIFLLLVSMFEKANFPKKSFKRKKGHWHNNRRTLSFMTKENGWLLFLEGFISTLCANDDIKVRRRKNSTFSFLLCEGRGLLN